MHIDSYISCGEEGIGAKRGRRKGGEGHKGGGEKGGQEERRRWEGRESRGRGKHGTACGFVLGIFGEGGREGS